jgi:hypothetical protein
VLKKASRKSRAVVVDVHADNPVGTMQRFADGLRRVLSARRSITPSNRRRKKRSSQA